MTMKVLPVMSPMLKCMTLLSLITLSSFWISESSMGVVAWQQHSSINHRQTVATRNAAMTLQVAPRGNEESDELDLSNISRPRHLQMPRREVAFALMGTLWGLTAASAAPGIANAAFEQQQQQGEGENPLEQMKQGVPLAQQIKSTLSNNNNNNQMPNQGQNPLDQVRQGVNDGTQRLQATTAQGDGMPNPWEKTNQGAEENQQRAQKNKQSVSSSGRKQGGGGLNDGSLRAQQGRSNNNNNNPLEMMNLGGGKDDKERIRQERRNASPLSSEELTDDDADHELGRLEPTKRGFPLDDPTENK